MKQNYKQWLDKIPSKGGLIGGLLGVLASSKFYNPADKPVKNVSKTVLLSGAGFILGQWLEKMMSRRK